jgi:hypothetical protein
MRLGRTFGVLVIIFGMAASAQAQSRFMMSDTVYDSERCYSEKSVATGRVNLDKMAKSKCSSEGYYYAKRLSEYDVNMSCDRIDWHGYEGERGRTDMKAEYFCTNKVREMSLKMNKIDFESTELTSELKCEGEGSIVIYRSNANHEEVHLTGQTRITLRAGDVLHFGNYVGGGWTGTYHQPFFSIEILGRSTYSVGKRNNGLGEFSFTQVVQGKNIIMANGRNQTALCVGKIKER